MSKFITILLLFNYVCVVCAYNAMKNLLKIILQYSIRPLKSTHIVTGTV
jgi:hypothetical protein